MPPPLPPQLGATLVGAAIETLKARANEELQRIASNHATVPWLAAAAYEKQSVAGGWSFDAPRAVTGNSVAEVEATLSQLEEPCKTLPLSDCTSYGFAAMVSGSRAGRNSSPEAGPPAPPTRRLGRDKRHAPVTTRRVFFHRQPASFQRDHHGLVNLLDGAQELALSLATNLGRRAYGNRNHWSRRFRTSVRKTGIEGRP